MAVSEVRHTLDLPLWNSIGESMNMLPKPTEETGVAIVSEASTATPVSSVGLSVASKGGSSVAPFFCVLSLFMSIWPILGNFHLFFGHFWAISDGFGHFLIVYRILVTLVLSEGSSSYNVTEQKV